MRFRPEVGATFASYLAFRVTGECLELVRRRNKKRAQLRSLDAYRWIRNHPLPRIPRQDGACRDIDTAQWDQNFIAEPQLNAEEHVLQMERHRQLWDAIAALPPKSRTVVMFRYRWDMDTTEICELMGLKPNRVNQIHRSAIEVLKAVMEA
jgi:RNA polymerase sigma factor (sigma-70 family)